MYPPNHLKKHPIFGQNLGAFSWKLVYWWVGNRPQIGVGKGQYLSLAGTSTYDFGESIPRAACPVLCKAGSKKDRDKFIFQ